MTEGLWEKRKEGRKGFRRQGSRKTQGKIGRCLIKGRVMGRRELGREDNDNRR